MLLPNRIQESAGKNQESGDWLQALRYASGAAASPATGNGTAGERSRAAVKTTPGLPDSIGVLRDWMGPQWSGCLDGFESAHEAANGNMAGALDIAMGEWFPRDLSQEHGGNRTGGGLSTELSTILPALTMNQDAGPLLSALGALGGKEGSKVTQSLLALGLDKALLSEAGSGFAQAGSMFVDPAGGGDLIAEAFDNLTANPGKLLQALIPFLPPEGQKAASAAASLLAGDPMGAIAAYLPPEVAAALPIANALASGDLSGALNALAGKYLPPELQGAFSALQQAGGITGLLDLPDISLPGLGGSDASAAGSVDADLSGGGPGGGGGGPWAARVSDQRGCPAGAGPILTGQPNVLIGFMPAARISDLGKCTGPPDTIVQGEPTVYIGGKPASRIGDGTAHGGKILTGFATVQIGKANGDAPATGTDCMAQGSQMGAGCILSSIK